MRHPRWRSRDYNMGNSAAVALRHKERDNNGALLVRGNLHRLVDDEGQRRRSSVAGLRRQKSIE